MLLSINFLDKKFETPFTLLFIELRKLSSAETGRDRGRKARVFLFNVCVLSWCCAVLFLVAAAQFVHGLGEIVQKTVHVELTV